ncbi:hypothetical protein Tco_0554561 [Tanacetum coccineum]
MYLKKAQSKKPCLYDISYDTSNLANRFTPDREETLTLEHESRSKLNKDLVKPYDYTKQNSLYEIFKPPSREYIDQLADANEDHLLKNIEDRGIFNSGCSAHMTGNKDHLDDFEECKGGSVTFGGSKGYITGKCYCHLMRANQRDSVFVKFEAMLHNISRDDLVDLYKIVLQKTTAYGLEEDLERAC